MGTTAYYTFSGSSGVICKCCLDIIIPKKKGDGFLKSCFGWHSQNVASEVFDDNRPKWFTTGDSKDIDGYLSIELRLYKFDDKFSEGLNEVFEALKMSFPYITDFKEDRDFFYETLINN